VSLNLDIPDSPRLRDKLAAGCLFVLVIAGFLAGYWVGSGNAPRPENASPAPAVRQGDGSVIAERQPDATPPAAPHEIPKGAREVRRVTTTVQPAQPDCDPVTVTTSLVQIDDGYRAITSTDNGTVVGALDLSIESLTVPPAPRRWAAGASYEPVRGLWGAWVERDFGRLRVGAEINQTRFGDAELRGRIGINF